MIRVVHPGSGSRIRILIFLPIPDPGIKKAPDPGSGSATLSLCLVFRQNVYGFLDSEAEPDDPGTFSYRDMEVRDNRQVDIVFVRV